MTIDQKKLFDLSFQKLKKVIRNGDLIYVELNTSKFLKIFKLTKNKDKFANFFYELFKKLIGKNGVFVTPSFSYSWGKENKKKIYDKRKTEPKTGILSKYLLQNKRNEVLRTDDPMFSVLVYGYKNKTYIENCNDSFGKKSIFEKIYNKNFKLVSFGIDQFDPTFVHYVEQYFDQNIHKIYYRKLYKLVGKIITKNKQTKKSYNVFLRNLKSNRTYSEKNIIRVLRKKKLIKSINLFGARIQVCYAKSFFDEGIKGMRKNNFFFTSKEEKSNVL
jgi:aminoglycoside N3'-acetyltransferase